MNTSLFNVMIAEDVKALVAKATADNATCTAFTPELPAERISAIIHGALWLAGARSGSTAGAYAWEALLHGVFGDADYVRNLNIEIAELRRTLGLGIPQRYGWYAEAWFEHRAKQIAVTPLFPPAEGA